jgi:uracil-DNA glycosylase
MPPRKDAISANQTSMKAFLTKPVTLSDAVEEKVVAPDLTTEAATSKKARTADEPSSVEAAPLVSAPGVGSATARRSAADVYANLEELIPADWREALKGEFSKPYWLKLKASLSQRASEGEQIFPPPELTFAALAACPLANTRIVLIGQDPYHDDGQAEGLCFSIPKTVKKLPSSLSNIYKELATDVPGWKRPAHGHLRCWAERGMLMLNTALTVAAHKANSHAGLGWTAFTDAVIRAVASGRTGVVWLCWGQPAQKKAAPVDTKTHCVLSCPHPSGLSAHRGFYGCKHFTKANEYLRASGQEEFDWEVK